MSDVTRVVVTGLGVLSPIGNNLEDYWQSAISGSSGSNYITKFDTSDFRTTFACELKNFNPENYLDRRELRAMDLCSVYGIVASEQAIFDSKICFANCDPYRIGVIWGTGIGGIESSSSSIKEYAISSSVPGREKKLNPFFIPKMIANMPAGYISIRNKLKGQSYVTLSACASSSHAIIASADSIKLGYSDLVVTGGSEAAITDIAITGFSVIRALSRRNESPKSASRPFDKDRDGFVMGEGSAALILESLDHAKKRGAKIYAEIVGYASTSDAYHITAPDSFGESVAQAMKIALGKAKLKPSDVDYINVHGTSTPVGDIAELNAIKKVFSHDLCKVNLSSTKSMTGHLLGASGAIESVAAIMAIKTKKIPPTINTRILDPEIGSEFNFTLDHFVEKNVTVAMNNTMAFGGHNTCLIFKEYVD